MHLTQLQRDSVYAIMLRLNGLKEDYPEELSYALSTALGENVDVSSLTPIQVSALFFDAVNDNSDILEEELESSIDVLPAAQPLSYMQMDFTGSGANGSQRDGHIGCTDPNANNYDPSATEDSGLCSYGGGGGFGGGSCDCYSYTYGPASDCYVECSGFGGTGMYCADPYADNYDALGDCTYADDGYGFGDFFSDAWDVVNEIGLGNIFNWITGGSNDAENPTTETPNTGGGGGGGTDDDDEETDWGKIALIAGGVLIVGLGIFFAFRKRK